MFLKPVLLQPRQGSQAGVRCMRFATALFVIQIRSAGRAKSAAITSTNCLHRHRKEHLLDQHLGQKQTVSFIKSNIGVQILQLFFFRLWTFGIGL